MKKPRMELGPGTALLGALLFFCLREEELLALGAALLIHELGHLAAIFLLGLRLRSFRAELGGFCLDYTGETAPWGHAFVAAAGPAAGAAYAYGASLLGNRLGWNWLCLSAGLSMGLSLFNLLPAAPLDGGRLLRPLLEAVLSPTQSLRVCLVMSLTVTLALLGLGAVTVLQGRGAAPLLAGAELLFHWLREAGLVKKREIR